MKKAETAKKFMDLFRGFAGAHGTHGVPEKDPDGLKWNIKGTASTKRQPVTVELWEQHLEGKRPLGVIPIREDNFCSWGSIDFDQYDVDLIELIQRVERSKLPLVPCRSKSGGLHLFLFLKEPEPASDVQNSLREAAASLGMAECEIFPKQTKVLTERHDLGNWMVMPYFGDDYGGKLKMQHGLKRTGADMSPEEFVRFCEDRRTTIVEFSKLCVVRRLDTSKAKNAKGAKKSKGDFSDGPPCLQHMTTAGVQKDGRKRIAFMMALYYKRAFPDEWQARLEGANQTYFSPPLPSSEISGIISSCEKKDYQYTCKEQPMASHCDSLMCRMRKFGVGKGGEYPVISSITKLLTDPPVWFVDVEGHRLELSSLELQNYVLFHRACLSRINKMYKTVKQDAWYSLVGDALEKLTTLDAPSDLGTEGRFRELLEEFLTNMARGQRKEDLFSGRPWEDVEDGKHYFTLRALQRHLTQEGMRDLSRHQIGRLIENMGGGHKFFNEKNQRGLNCWWVPSSAVHAIAELPTPKIKDEEI